MSEIDPVIETIRRRRSIRHFDERPVPPEVLDALREALVRSPTAMNLRAWHFAFTTDRDKLVALSVAKERYATPLARATMGVAICGDERVSNCWVEDCSIAATMLQLEAAALGLGSCWIQMRERTDAEGRSSEERVREILGLPSELRVLTVVALGYPAEDKPAHVPESLPWDRVTGP